MDNEDWIIVLFLLAVLFFIGFSGFVGNHEGYKAGQIDAANGIMHYELQKQKDGSVRWVYIENKKEDDK